MKGDSEVWWWWWWWEDEGVGGFIAIPALRSCTRDVAVGALTAGLAAAGESTVGLYGYPRSISSLPAKALAHNKTRR